MRLKRQIKNASAKAANGLQILRRKSFLSIIPYADNAEVDSPVGEIGAKHAKSGIALAVVKIPYI